MQQEPDGRAAAPAAAVALRPPGPGLRAPRRGPDGHGARAAAAPGAPPPRAPLAGALTRRRIVLQTPPRRELTAAAALAVASTSTPSWSAETRNRGADSSTPATGSPRWSRTGAATPTSSSEVS